jgi:hypothetical protein
MSYLVLLSLFATNPAQASAAELRFDFQGSFHPTQVDSTPVNPDTSYSRTQGYGITSSSPLSVAYDRGNDLLVQFGYHFTAPYDVLATHPNGTDVQGDDTLDPDLSLRRDALGGDPFSFAVDVPNGRYDVTVWLGDVTEPVYFMDVQAEGDVAVRNAHAVTAVNRLLVNEVKLGGSHRETFRVEVLDGQLNLDFGSFDSDAGPWHVTASGKAFPGAKGNIDFDADIYPAFSEVMVQGVSIARAEDWTVYMDAGALQTDSTDPDLLDAIDAFNAGEFQEALTLAYLLSDEEALDKASLLVWLAGRPEVDNEDVIIPIAFELIEDHLTLFPEDALATQISREIWDIHAAYGTIAMLGYGAGQASYRNQHAAALLEGFPEDHPFYTKAHIRIARSRCGLDPNGNMGYYLAQQRLVDVETTFPDNKYVKLYVHREWSEPDWDFPLPEVDESAPEWAKAIYQSHELIGEFVSWWVDNRLNENGEFGGGYSDDVEIIVPLLEFMLLVVDDGDEDNRAALESFLENIWDHKGGLDANTGFSALIADAEHSAELSADGYSLTVPMYYGDPVYFERNLKTASLLENVWGGVGGDGLFHFKGSIFNGVKIKGKAGATGMDEAINMRALFNANWVLWYSDHPQLEATLLDYADTLSDVAMRTDLGKPQGVLGAPVDFATGEIGGPGGNWWGSKTATNGSWYEFPSYTIYPHSFLVAQYLRTENAAYLEPLLWENDLVANYADSVEDPEKGSNAWAANKVQNALAEVAVELKRATGTHDFDDALATMAGKETKSWVRTSWLASDDPTEMAQAMQTSIDAYEDKWPFFTTEGLMTDRIAHGMELVPVSAMTGTSAYTNFQGFTSTIATYKAPHRDFAAWVRDGQPESTRIALYNFDEETLDLGVRLWRFKPGATLQVKLGLDTDDDGFIDETVASFDWVLNHRGDPLHIPVDSKTSMVLKVSEKSAGDDSLRADLALTGADLQASDDQLAITVHNIGSKTVSEATVSVYDGPEWLGQLREEVSIRNLAAPLDYVAKTVTVDVDGVSSKCSSTFVVVNEKQVVDEITTVNNRVSMLPQGCGSAPIAIGKATGSTSKLKLTARDSSDADGDDLRYQWRQIQGPAVALHQNPEGEATVIVPALTHPALLTFELRVSDGIFEDTDRVSFVAEPMIKKAPTSGCSTIPTKVTTLGTVWMAFLALFRR